VTAWNALVAEGGIRAGDSVLVLGTGGVSLFALQFARLHGARVIATSSSDDKLARAIALGASDGINYRQTPEWGRAVLELTGGAGVNHVIEVGGAGTLPQSFRACVLAADQPDRSVGGARRPSGSASADDEGRAPAGDLRGIARDVRSHEPGDCARWAAAGGRPGVPVCGSAGGVSLHASRGTLRENRNQPGMNRAGHARPLQATDKFVD